MSRRGGRRAGAPNWGKTPQVVISALNGHLHHQCQRAGKRSLTWRDTDWRAATIASESAAARSLSNSRSWRANCKSCSSCRILAWGDKGSDSAASGLSSSTRSARPRIRSAAWARSLTTAPATTSTSGLVASPGPGVGSVSRFPLFNRALRACRETPTAVAASLRRRTWTCTYPNVESGQHGRAQRHAQPEQFLWPPLPQALRPRLATRSIAAGQVRILRVPSALHAALPIGRGSYPFETPRGSNVTGGGDDTRRAGPRLPWPLQWQPGLAGLHAGRRGIEVSAQSCSQRCSLESAPTTCPKRRAGGGILTPSWSSSAPTRPRANRPLGKRKPHGPSSLARRGHMRFRSNAWERR